MSHEGQQSTQILIDAGADIYAKDTYGYTALHRMASNNLAVGGEALVKAGMDPTDSTGADESPMQIAKQARAGHFLNTMKGLGY
jgi:ankyrin repeat protein